MPFCSLQRYVFVPPWVSNTRLLTTCFWTKLLSPDHLQQCCRQTFFISFWDFTNSVLHFWYWPTLAFLQSNSVFFFSLEFLFVVFAWILSVISFFLPCLYFDKRARKFPSRSSIFLSILSYVIRQLIHYAVSCGVEDLPKTIGYAALSTILDILTDILSSFMIFSTCVSDIHHKSADIFVTQ